jgi:hypothetical protein
MQSRRRLALPAPGAEWQGSGSLRPPSAPMTSPTTAARSQSRHASANASERASVATLGTASTRLRAARTARSASWRLRVAKIGKHPIAHLLGHKTTVALDQLRQQRWYAAIMPRRSQRRRANQVAKHAREPAVLGTVLPSSLATDIGGAAGATEALPRSRNAPSILRDHRETPPASPGLDP